MPVKVLTIKQAPCSSVYMYREPLVMVPSRRQVIKLYNPILEPAFFVYSLYQLLQVQIPEKHS